MSNQRPLNRHPAGAEPYDDDALNDYQQQKTNQKKIQLRLDNEKYLREHPEIQLLIQDFMRESFLNKPNDVREFAAYYFTDPKLNDKVNNLLKDNQRKTEVNKIIQQMKTQDLNKFQ